MGRNVALRTGDLSNQGRINKTPMASQTDILNIGVERILVDLDKKFETKFSSHGSYALRNHVDTGIAFYGDCFVN